MYNFDVLCIWRYAVEIVAYYYCYNIFKEDKYEYVNNELIL